MGGELEVASVSGVGSSFVLVLPGPAGAIPAAAMAVATRTALASETEHLRTLGLLRAGAAAGSDADDGDRRELRGTIPTTGPSARAAPTHVATNLVTRATGLRCRPASGASSPTYPRTSASMAGWWKTPLTGPAPDPYGPFPHWGDREGNAIHEGLGETRP